jgi:large subunit ribosomal protein LP0
MQMHQIRQALRGKGTVLMGKNTMVRRALRMVVSERPEFERLMPHVKGNIGFVFTASDLKEVRELILANRVAAPARAGAYAPADVYVPAGNTGMEPGKTSFFQALGIPTKIARGTIEIVSDVKVVSGGSRVGTSEATLLNMLNISPFTYGMTVVQIYDSGNTFTSDVLDVEEKTLTDRFSQGIQQIAAISLALNYPTIVSVGHSLVNAYKNLLAVSLATEYEFEGSAKVRAAERSERCGSGGSGARRGDRRARGLLQNTLKIRTAAKLMTRSWPSAPISMMAHDVARRGCGALGLPRCTVLTLYCHAHRPRPTWPTRRPSPLRPRPPPRRRRPLPRPLPRPRRRRRRRRATTTWASVSSTKRLVLYRSEATPAGSELPRCLLAPLPSPPTLPPPFVERRCQSDALLAILVLAN